MDSWTVDSTPNFGPLYIGLQEALLLQMDRMTRLSVEILQLQIIQFEKDCNR